MLGDPLNEFFFKGESDVVIGDLGSWESSLLAWCWLRRGLEVASENDPPLTNRVSAAGDVGEGE